MKSQSTYLDDIRAADRAKAKLRGEMLANVQPAWLCDAVRATVHVERGTAKVIADVLGCSVHHVTDLADPTRRVSLKAYEIPGLVRASGSYAVLDAIEAQVSRVAFSLPSVNPHLDEMNRELARTIRQFGEFLETNGEALADGVIEPHEVKPLVKSLDAILAGVSEYRAMVLEKARDDAAA